MSKTTRDEVKFKRRGRYARSGQKHKGKLIDHAIDLFDYHRKVDNPAVVPLLNALTTGRVGQLVNLFGPALKLKSKERSGYRIQRVYQEAQTPYEPE